MESHDVYRFEVAYSAACVIHSVYLSGCLTNLLAIIIDLVQIKTSTNSIFLHYSAAFVQMLEKSIPDWELNIGRNFGVFVCTCIILLYRKSSILVQKDDILLLLTSCILFISNAYLFYVSVVYLPLSTAYSVVNASGLMLGLVVFKIFLQEPVTCIKSASVILCVVSTLLVVQPDFTLQSYIEQQEGNNMNASYSITNNNFENKSQEETPDNNFENEETHNLTLYIVIFGYGYALFAGLTKSAVYVTFKLLSKRELSSFLVMFWGSLLGIFVSIVFTFILEVPVVPSTLMDIFCFLGHSVSMGLRYATLILQVEYLDSTYTGIISVCSNMLSAVVFQYTILQDIMPGNRNVLEVCGVILMVYAATQTALVEILKDKCWIYKDVEDK